MCGNALIALQRGGNWNKGFEHRRPGVAANVLDGAVWSEVEDMLTRPEVVAAEVARQRAADPHAAELALLDRRGAGLDARRKGLARAVVALEHEGASAPLLAELRGLAEQAREVKTERQAVGATAAAREADRELLDGLAAWSARALDNLPRLGYEERRSVLCALGAEVRVLPSPAVPRWELTLRWGDLLDVIASDTSS